MIKTYTFEVVMKDELDHFEEEDIVKNLWPSLAGFMTRSRGVDKGKIILNDGNIVLTWTYKDNWDDFDD